MQSKRGIRRALEYAGWEVRWPSPTEDDPEAIVGGYGPYRLVVRFDTDRGEGASRMWCRCSARAGVASGAVVGETTSGVPLG